MNDSAHPDRLGAKEATQEERVGRPVDVESQTCNWFCNASLKYEKGERHE